MITNYKLYSILLLVVNLTVPHFSCANDTINDVFGKPLLILSEKSKQYISENDSVIYFEGNELKFSGGTDSLSSYINHIYWTSSQYDLKEYRGQLLVYILFNEENMIEEVRIGKTKFTENIPINHIFPLLRSAILQTNGVWQEQNKKEGKKVVGYIQKII